MATPIHVDWGRAGVDLLDRLLYSPTHSYHSVACVQKPKHDKVQTLEMLFSLWFDLSEWTCQQNKSVRYMYTQ